MDIGPWFLSIFVSTLPWESGGVLFIVSLNRLKYITSQHSSTLHYLALISVLRVWDVILFEGNRVMLFRTALALMDLYGTCYIFYE